MIRKILMLIAPALALLIAVSVPSALAQGETNCEPVVFATPESTELPAGADDDAAADCANPVAYPGPFTNVPASPAGPYSAPTGLAATPPPRVPAAATEPEPGSGPGSGSPLAHSGSETFVLAYLGTGLLAFGAVALGLRRGPAAE